MAAAAQKRWREGVRQRRFNRLGEVVGRGPHPPWQHHDREERHRAEKWQSPCAEAVARLGMPELAEDDQRDGDDHEHGCQ